MPIFGTFFWMCVCNWKASSKNWKSSWEQHWVCTHISFRTAVQLHLWIFLSVFQSCVCVIQSLNVAQPWKLFPQVRVKFKDAYRTHATAMCLSKVLMESLLATTKLHVSGGSCGTTDLFSAAEMILRKKKNDYFKYQSRFSYIAFCCVSCNITYCSSLSLIFLHLPW